MPTEKIVTILGKSLTVLRLSLKGWSRLESVKVAMDEAISERDYDNYFLATVRFIEMALPSQKSKIKWETLPWHEFLYLYSEIATLNSPTFDFPLLMNKGKKEAEKKLPWEYEGRSWFFWLNLFASHYGWSEQVIGDLDIDTAIGLYQEVLIDDQMGKEWEWGLSEIAYPYKKSTNSQEYKPLERPEWMLPISPKELPIIRMRRDMLPVGMVVNLEEDYKAKKEGNKRGV